MNKATLRLRVLVRHLRDGALFATAPALAAVSPLLVVPIVVHKFGINVWADIAIGQSIGLFAASVIEFGWPLSAVVLLSGKSDVDRSRVYLQCLHASTLLFLPVVACVIVAATYLASHSVVLAVLSGIATSSTGLGATWFHAANGTPKTLLFRESLIRIISSPVGALIAVLLNAVWILPLVQMIGSFIAVWLVSRPMWLLADLRQQNSQLRLVVLRLQTQAPFAVTRMGTSASYMLPIAIIAASNSDIIAEFAALDRIEKFVVTAVIPIALVLQSKVSSEPNGVVRVGVRSAWIAIATLAFVVLTATTFAASGIQRYLFASQIQSVTSSTVLLGMLTSIAVVNRVSQLIIVGRSTGLNQSLSTIAFTLLGFCAIYSFAGWGIQAAIGSVLLLELVLFIQFVCQLLTWKRSGSAHALKNCGGC